MSDFSSPFLTLTRFARLLFTGPGVKSVAVTPSDTVNIAGGPARFLYIGVPGNVTIENLDGTTAQYQNHPVGYLYAECTRVNATGTTASGIVALL